MYELRISREADRGLDACPIEGRARLGSAIQALAQVPRPPGSQKLTGIDLWRIRVGDYRVVYEIRDRQLVILVVRVAHRREVYR